MCCIYFQQERVLDMTLEVTMAINFPPALYVENARSGRQTAGWASTITELEYVRAALRHFLTVCEFKPHP